MHTTKSKRYQIERRFKKNCKTGTKIFLTISQRRVFLRSKMSLLVASTSKSVTTLEFRWEIFWSGYTPGDKEINKCTSNSETAETSRKSQRFSIKMFFFCFFFCWCLSNKRSHNNNATNCTNPSNQPARLFERKNVTEKNKYSKYEQTMCLATNKSQFSIWTNYEKNRLALNLRPFNLFDYSAKGHNILCMIVHQQFSRWLVIIFRRKIDQFSEFSSFLSF